MDYANHMRRMVNLNTGSTFKAFVKPGTHPQLAKGRAAGFLKLFFEKCACACVCVYVCMDVCMYVYMYACMYVCMHVCMHACMYVCMHACMFLIIFLDGRRTTFGDDYISYSPLLLPLSVVIEHFCSTGWVY